MDKLPTDAELVELIDLVDSHWAFVEDSLRRIIDGQTLIYKDVPIDWLEIGNRANGTCEPLEVA